MIVQGDVLVAGSMTMGELGLVTRTEEVTWHSSAVSELVIAEDVMARGVGTGWMSRVAATHIAPPAM